LASAGVSNVNIIGGTVQGDRANHTDTGGEWGFGIDLRGSNNVFVESVTARDNWGDGFYIGGNAKNSTFCSVVADNNRRQGMSITSADGIVVKNSIFKNTHGASPQSGIDIEPNAGERVDNAQILNSQFLNNASAGVEFYLDVGTTSNVLVSGNTMTGNTFGISGQKTIGVTFTNNTTKSNSRYGIGFREGSTGNKILCNTVTSNSGAGISFITGSTGNTVTGNTVTGNAGGQILDSVGGNTVNESTASCVTVVPPTPTPNPTPTPPPPPGGGSGTMQLTGTFESGNLSGWNYDGSSRTTVVTSPVHNGSYAARMVAGPGGDPIYRTELVAGSAGFMNDNTEYWIGASVRIESAFPGWGAVLQTHAVPHGGNWNCMAGKNPISIGMSGNKMSLNIASANDKTNWQDGSAMGNAEVWSQTVSYGTWYNWVFRFIPSINSNGVIEAWVNGTKIFTQNGGNRVPNDACGLPADPSVYLKIGIYRDYSAQSTQIIEYDDVRIFRGTGGYSQVAR
jgi:parallel beta-helix repeat protein